jgi:hypothetical protein
MLIVPPEPRAIGRWRSTDDTPEGGPKRLQRTIAALLGDHVKSAIRGLEQLACAAHTLTLDAASLGSLCSDLQVYPAGSPRVIPIRVLSLMSAFAPVQKRICRFLAPPSPGTRSARSGLHRQRKKPRLRRSTGPGHRPNRPSGSDRGAPKERALARLSSEASARYRPSQPGGGRSDPHGKRP